MSREIHLTSGPIMPQLVRLCLPLLAANVLQQLYNIINSLVVTYYIGDSAFAALGVAESVMNLFIYVITGACMGASVLIAQFYGEENFPRLRQPEDLLEHPHRFGSCRSIDTVSSDLWNSRISTCNHIQLLLHLPDFVAG